MTVALIFYFFRLKIPESSPVWLDSNHKIKKFSGANPHG